MPDRTNPSTGTVSFAQIRRDFPNIPGGSADEVVLNFALTLEILEADLYRQALNIASGRDANNALASSPDEYALKIPSGLTKISRNSGFAYLADYAFVEAAHRDFLISAITAAGLTPTTRNPGGYAFPGGSPGDDLETILTSILALEETGTRAYLGALPYIQTVDYQVAAGKIYSTECRHSAAIRNSLGMDPGPEMMTGDQSVSPNLQSRINTVFEYGLAPSTVLSAASAYFVS